MVSPDLQEDMLNDAPSLTTEDRFVIRSHPMFARLGDDVFEQLAAAAFLVRAAAKTEIFSESAPATDIYIVLDGWLKLYRMSPSGVEAIINIFSRGQSCAEAVALTGQRYPATAEAISDCRLVRLPTVHLVQALKANPDVALAMLASVTAHLHRLVGEIERLKGLNGLARVVEFLTHVDGGRGSQNVTLPFEKHVLARHLGMQPESLSRTLKRLRAFGVEVEGRRVSIDSWDNLRRAASDPQ